MNEKHQIKRVMLKFFAAFMGVAAITGFGISSANAGTIKVGAPIPITGPYASDGIAMEKGIRMAVEELNASGGVLGDQLEIYVFDIGDLTPDKLQAAATNLAEKEKVDVLINGYGGMGPDIPAFCPYDIPYIHNDATSNVVELRDQMNCTNIFMGSDLDVNYGKVAFRQILDLDHEFPNKRLAVIHGPYDWEFNNADGAEAAAKKDGWDVVMSEEAPYGTTQWGSILSKLRAADPSVIYFEILDPVAVSTFIDQFVDNPAKNALLYVGYTVSVPAFSEVVKSGKADGVLGMTLSAFQPNDRGTEFVERWTARFGEEPPLSIAAQIYDEVMLWAQAVESVGSAQDFKAVGMAIKASTYEGVTGKFQFTDNHVIPSNDDTIPAHLLQAGKTGIRQIMIGSEKMADFATPPWMK